MAKQTHIAGQNCLIVQKEGFWDALSNKQVFMTGIVVYNNSLGFGKLLIGAYFFCGHCPWPFGKDLVDWELLGGEFVMLIYLCFLGVGPGSFFFFVVVFPGRVVSSTLLLFHRANAAWIWWEQRLQQLHIVHLATPNLQHLHQPTISNSKINE